VQRTGPGASSGGMLLEIIDRILDKGIVIDAWVRVSLVGIELITIEARVVVASVDTYLKYAEAIGATQLASRPEPVVEAAPVPNLPASTTPSDDEVVRYLSENTQGLPLEEVEHHFDIPRSRAQNIVNHLLEENRVQRDEQRGVYLPDQRDRR
jgi:hypothetical protein